MKFLTFVIALTLCLFSCTNGEEAATTSKEVQKTILEKIKKANIIKEEVISLKKIDTGFKLQTNKSDYFFPKIVLAIGGHSNYTLLKDLDIKIVEPIVITHGVLNLG